MTSCFYTCTPLKNIACFLMFWDILQPLADTHTHNLFMTLKVKGWKRPLPPAQSDPIRHPYEPIWFNLLVFFLCRGVGWLLVKSLDRVFYGYTPLFATYLHLPYTPGSYCEQIRTRCDSAGQRLSRVVTRARGGEEDSEKLAVGEIWLQQAWMGRFEGITRE